MTDMAQEKGNRYHKLTLSQKSTNRLKARCRARFKHIFGFMTNTMNAMYIRTIGYARATEKIGSLANLTYNMMRCIQLNRVIRGASLGISAPKRPLRGAFRPQISQKTVFLRIVKHPAGMPGRNDISKLSYYSGN